MVVQWGTEQGVVVQWGTEQGVVVQRGTEQGVVVQQGTEQEVVVQWGTEQGVVVQQGMVVQWNKGLGAAEGRTCDTRGQHIVQLGRQLLVAYFEGGAVASREEFDPWAAAQDRPYLVYLTQ